MSASGARSRVERLGTEKTGTLLWSMSAQATFALLVAAICGLTETYVLARGINALAAAGAAVIAPVLIALGGVTTTLGAGGASVVSRALGGRQDEKAARAVANTFVIFWAAALVIAGVGTVVIEPLVGLLGATERIAPYAIAYGRIIFLGAVTSTGFSAIIRADGSARYATAIWVIPLTVNLALCWLCVMVWGLGVAGAALATVAGQAVSAGMSIYFFFFRPQRPYRITAAHFRPDWPIIREVVLIGFPSLIKYGSVSLLAIITNHLLRRLGGDGALVVFAIVSRLSSALVTPQTGIVQGMQPLVGYNVGQRQGERVRQAIRLSLLAAVAYGAAGATLCLLDPAGLIGLLSQERAVLAEGQTALRLLALAYPLAGVSLVTAAALQAAGRVRAALLLTLGGVLLVRLPVLLLASRFFALNGIWAAEAISELILCLVSFGLLRQFAAPRQPEEARRPDEPGV